MKLRNKKTGKIGDFCYGFTNELCVAWQKDDGFWEKKVYHSLAELNEDWEDAPEEPKCGYIIDPLDEDGYSRDDDCFEEGDRQRAKELGIWFETKEEAEKAVEKLKARKRLKDKGFKFVGWKNGKLEYPDYVSFDCEDYKGCAKDLDIVFGGEE